MKEIKFRAWNKETKCFFIWDLKFAFGGTGAVWGDVQQYTGLKDKNGKEIYEGDICRVTGGEQWQGYTEIDFIGEVLFVTASFCVKDKNDCHYDFGYIENVEVIGNIYENPESMK